jgi:hypothetical protein
MRRPEGRNFVYTVGVLYITRSKRQHPIHLSAQIWRNEARREYENTLANSKNGRPNHLHSVWSIEIRMAIAIVGSEYDKVNVCSVLQAHRRSTQIISTDHFIMGRYPRPIFEEQYQRLWRMCMQRRACFTRAFVRLGGLANTSRDEIDALKFPLDPKSS